jgi:cell division protein FtsB
MYRLRVASRLVLLCALLLALPALILSNLVSRTEIDGAEALYERTRRDLESTDARLRDAEARLTRLTTSVNAVEQEARERFRLIRPGETLVLIEQE